MKQLTPTKVYEIVDKPSMFGQNIREYCVITLPDYSSVNAVETTDKYLLSKEELEKEKVNFAINVLNETLKEHLKYSIDYNTTKSIIDMQIEELKKETK
jgi:hypothetical protein